VIITMKTQIQPSLITKMYLMITMQEARQQITDTQVMFH
jgi:hypothetical protein